MLTQNIHIPEESIQRFCEKHHITKLAFFGSVLRDDFSESSDVDVLVEFDEDHIPGFAFFGMQEELTNLLGREVELHTRGFLSPYFRDRVTDEAVVLYERK